MVFRDSQRKKNLSWQYVKYETIKLYREGIRHLEHNGCTVLGIVCDGRRGIFKAFDSYPIQMCQFHQKAIITRYLTQWSSYLLTDTERSHKLAIIKGEIYDTQEIRATPVYERI